MIIDTHAHVNFKDFKDDYQEVLNRAHEKNIAIINVGSQISTSRRAADLAQKFDKTFAAVGLHPVHLQNFEISEEHASFQTRAEDFEYAVYQDLARLPQVVAIGECGLDYYHLHKAQDIIEAKEKQKQSLHLQIELANEENLPLILHCRGSQENPQDAYLDLLSELKKHLPKSRGVIHCFGSNWQIAKQYIELGFYLGFNGIITFDKSGFLAEIIMQMPIDRILTETDCPYLTPEPFRGKRNEPAYVEYVVKKIAQIRQDSFENIAQKTTANAKNLFDLVV